MTDIRKVGVIGAGVMGAGIAAHMANAGLPVVLLDVVPDGANARNVLSDTAVARLLKTNPAPFMHKRNARRIVTGNIEDDLDQLGECDWIIEAIIENLDAKRDLYARIENERKTGSMVSSNTSTILLEKLTEDLPERFCKDFAITHFFNPPRYMRLLEVVVGPQTRPDVLQSLRIFGDQTLGKSVVTCKDTPGFIANRIGILWMESAVRFAFEDGLTVEEADAVIGRPMGIPKTGVFGLMDLVGIDLQPHVAASMLATLPERDLYRDIHQPSPFIDHMIETGFTGRKGKGGFYRLNTESGKRVKESIDLETGEYHPSTPSQLESVAAGRQGLRALVNHPDKGGRYAWRVLSHTLSYAASLVPEIADTIQDVDEAMRAGYAWKWGPFELLDQLGPAWFSNRLQQDGMPVPELVTAVGEGNFYRNQDSTLESFGHSGRYNTISRAEGVLMLSDIKREGDRIAGNSAASAWDLGDQVLCLEFHTKMNSLDAEVFKVISEVITLIPAKGFQALVIYNEGNNFSVGVNLGQALFAANLAGWSEIGKSVKQGQDIYQALKYAPFPVVGAPSGMALGGGCEVLLHCDAIQAHAETYLGLVEVGVGLVPAWGGCKEMLLRWMNNPKHPQGPMAAVGKVFEAIGMAKVSRSAEEARDLLFLRPTDNISMNRDRLLADAKAMARRLAADYSPPTPPEIRLPGPSGRAAMKMAVRDLCKAGKATTHDQVVTSQLAYVLSGGEADPTVPVNEADVLRLERNAIMALLKNPGTLARMEHMLESGKPLRN